VDPHALKLLDPDSAPRELDVVTLERCRRGDRAAFARFVACYKQRIFAHLSRLLGRGPHVDDLAQETFLRAYAALPGFALHGPARPSTWLLTIATRLALDLRKRAPIPVEPLRGFLDHGPTTPERECQRRQLGAAIAAAAATLTVEQRTVFVLAEIEDLPLDEIARIVDVPVATVKTRLFRAREALRRQLGPLWRED